MAPIGSIYGYVGHPKVNRALGAAKYNGLELEVVETSAMKGDTRKPEYRAIFPYGKIPGFKGSDGFTLAEGKAIAKYSKCLRLDVLFGRLRTPPCFELQTGVDGICRPLSPT